MSNGDEVSVEVTIGLGDTLSSVPDDGYAYRVCVDRETFDFSSFSFISNSHVLVAHDDVF